MEHSGLLLRESVGQSQMPLNYGKIRMTTFFRNEELVWDYYMAIWLQRIFLVD